MAKYRINFGDAVYSPECMGSWGAIGSMMQHSLMWNELGLWCKQARSVANEKEISKQERKCNMQTKDKSQGNQLQQHTVSKLQTLCNCIQLYATTYNCMQLYTDAYSYIQLYTSVCNCIGCTRDTVYTELALRKIATLKYSSPCQNMLPRY